MKLSKFFIFKLLVVFTHLMANLYFILDVLKFNIQVLKNLIGKISVINTVSSAQTQKYCGDLTLKA